jgi:hypothetical protein
MSKTFIIAASVAGASAMAAPRIELDLSAMSNTVSKDDLANTALYKNLIATHTTGSYVSGHHDSSTTATYDATGTATGTKNIGSRQDWTEQCAAATATTANCPFPTARAYDHNDETVSVATNVYLIDFDGKNTFDGQSLPAKVAAADVFGNDKLKNKRATYLFKYDATDAAGNRAEQVVFALILNDLKAPQIDSCYNAKKVVVEAASQRQNGKFEFFCGPGVKRSLPPAEGSDKRETVASPDAVKPMASATKYQADDTVDGVLSQNIRFKLYQVNAAHSGAVGSSDTAAHSGLNLWQAGEKMTTRLTAAQAATGARWIVEAYVSDKAGYYGSNGEDNKASDFLDVKIVDTTAPRIQLEGANTVYGECCAEGQGDACAKQTHAGFREGRSLAFDANDGDISANIVSTGSFTIDGTDFTSDAIACTADEQGKCFTVDLTKTATKTIYHRVTDAAGNKGVRFQGGHNTLYAQRTAEVVDRNPPKVALKGSDTTTLKSTRANGNNANYLESLDLGVSKKDTCVAEEGLNLAIEWKDGKSPGDLTNLGTFTRIYKVCDRVTGGSDATKCDGTTLWSAAQTCCANGDIPAKAIPCCDSVERTFEVIDDEAPEIEVMGDKKLVIDASTVQEYTDAGATCNDYVDGVLSHAVEVSGEVVNMRRPGTYTIRYDCVDLSGKEANPEFREVKVVDRTCPTVKLNGAAVNYVEAGFPYMDAGFVATDDLDGIISGKGVWGKDKAGCKTDGDTVNSSQAFYDRRSCAAIAANCDGNTCTTGEYYISAYNKKTNQYVRVLVWCNMNGSTGKTYYPIMDAEKAAVPGAMNNGSNDCHALGMDMATFTSADEKNDALSKFCPNGIKNGCLFFQDVAAPQRQYLCSPNDEAIKQPTATGDAKPSSKAGHSAEVGTYHIKFMCKDRAGNEDCAWKQGKPVTRTVYVKDTLPPVITLHLRNKLIARSSGAQVGLNGKTNPAGDSTGNPNITPTNDGKSLMAEETTTSANGWVMGAVASAVSGLALLGYSLRRNTATVVSVPV